MDTARLRPGCLLRPRGKNLRFPYLIRSALHGLTPHFLLNRRLETLDAELASRPDRDAIEARLRYYCKPQTEAKMSGTQRLCDIPNGLNNYTRYLFEYSRYFEPSLFIDTAFGDNTGIPATASVLKSRR